MVINIIEIKGECHELKRLSFLLLITGCNTVIKSFPLKSDDAILINNLTYPAVANTAMHTAATCGEYYYWELQVL